MNRLLLCLAGVVSTVLACNPTRASQDSIGPNGIESDGLLNAVGNPLTGSGMSIGMVEQGRVGIAGTDSSANLNSTLDPEAVFRQELSPNTADVLDHSTQVAGVMISTDATATGVAPGASLYGSAYVTLGSTDAIFADVLASVQHIATQTSPSTPKGDVRAINHSWGKPLPAGSSLDGSSQLTLGMDWIATKYDILNVVAGNEGTNIPLPTDNFNGVTVAYTSKAGQKFRQVSSVNTFDEDAVGARTSIDLLAPGDGILMTDLNNTTSTSSGTSFAAPHVTGTVALLQEYAEERMDVAAPRWGANSRRHEVMKAVLMNSADKLEDNCNGCLLGMTRTVLKTNTTTANQGDTWLNSAAATDPDIPLDEQMGAGHLNASRALTQFKTGEFNFDVNLNATVAGIGWDYGHSPGPDIITYEPSIVKYLIDAPISMGDYVAATLAWDRQVRFDDDAGGDDMFDRGDTFFEPLLPEDSFNNLALYLMPSGATDLSQALASSTSFDMTVQHIFSPVPTTQEYELWVVQYNGQATNETGQDYALAWWTTAPTTIVMDGDFDGNGITDEDDYTLWASSYGSTATPGTGADGNGDGVVNAADYTVWRDAFAAASATAAVPEPTTVAMALAGLLALASRRRLA
jgi:hypothetical protein